ncbi:agmatinase [Candidatus Micrarchaeota archaeon]|nr:agmatinase [Candidatus Micrarchaeota archaeon]
MPRSVLRKKERAESMEKKQLERFGLDWSGLLTDSDKEADIYIKGIPFDNAASVGKGAASAADRIRYLSRVLPPSNENGIFFEDLKIKDNGNFQPDLNWERFFNTIEREAQVIMGTEKFCIFIGGDHSITIPLMKAFGQVHRKEKIGYIHFDSHSDLCDNFEGHIWSHGSPARRAIENCNNLNDEGMTFVGIRAYEKEEVEFYRKHKDILVIEAEEIFEKGVYNVIAKISERYEGYDTIYLTLDIDVLDPAFAPGTGTPEAGGLSTRELMKILKELIANLPIKAMDLVEVSPPLDSADITSWAALKLIYSVFGQRSLLKKSF